MSYLDYNTDDKICQEEILPDEVLTDKNGTKERPWMEHKRQARQLSEMYRVLDNDKAERIYQCGNWLSFVQDGEVKRLHKANFCRVRLCPLCQWRRALKVYGQMTRVCNEVDWTRYQAVMLTLTLRNCALDALSQTLDVLVDGYHRMMQYKAVSDVVVGYYRAVEVTVNAGDRTLHPHIHALLVVDKSYFCGRKYLSQDKWTGYWRRACKLDYDPIVHVQRVKMEAGKDITDAIREVAKYTVKSSDIIGDDYGMLATLDGALNKRRFVGLGGLLKDIHKRLSLTPIDDDADLVHVADDIGTASADEIYYIWHSGLYVRWLPEKA